MPTLSRLPRLPRLPQLPLHARLVPPLNPSRAVLTSRTLGTLAIAASAIATPVFATPLFAQQSAVIPIRAVTPPSATSPHLQSVDELREIAGGKLLVNDAATHQLMLFDAMLQHPAVLADTTGSVSAYPRFGKLIPYTADSSLFYESDSRSLVLIDGQGRLGRVLALPRPQDFNMMTSGAPVATDGHGHLVYQGRRSLGFPPPCRVAGDASPVRPLAPPPSDSVVIIRADFETRTVDTVARAKAIVPGVSFPITTADANCGVLAAKVRVNPSIPLADSWTVTTRGAVAIVRSHDYHIDWISADGTRRSTPKMAFDWRRLTDADKQQKIDSARRIIDSLTAKGGYRLRVCGGGRSTSFTIEPQDATGGGDVMVVGGGGGRGGSAGGADGASPGAGRGPNDCQTVTVAAEFVPLDSMTDYIAPIREESAHADLDGNVWILPTTSASAKGGLLYDVVNPDGELVERVQLPGGRSIAGFGRGSVLYLSKGDYKTGYVIEKVRVIR